MIADRRARAVAPRGEAEHEEERTPSEDELAARHADQSTLGGRDTERREGIGAGPRSARAPRSTPDETRLAWLALVALGLAAHPLIAQHAASMRVRAASPVPHSAGAELTFLWSGHSCRIGDVLHVLEIHPDDAGSFHAIDAALRALEVPPIGGS